MAGGLAGAGSTCTPPKPHGEQRPGAPVFLPVEAVWRVTRRPVQNDPTASVSCELKSRTMPLLRVAPSILSADFGRLAEEVRAIEVAGADYVHVDVMDGRFVPNITVGARTVAAVRSATRLPIDVHLMIVEPERHLAAFAEAGADIMSVHLEGAPHLHRTVQQIRALGKRASVAVNPHSPIDGLDVVLPDLSMVLLMTVNPGF